MFLKVDIPQRNNADKQRFGKTCPVEDYLEPSRISMTEPFFGNS